MILDIGPLKNWVRDFYYVTPTTAYTHLFGRYSILSINTHFKLWWASMRTPAFMLYWLNIRFNSQEYIVKINTIHTQFRHNRSMWQPYAMWTEFSELTVSHSLNEIFKSLGQFSRLRKQRKKMLQQISWIQLKVINWRWTWQSCGSKGYHFMVMILKNVCS